LQSLGKSLGVIIKLTLLANSYKYPMRTIGRYNRVYWRYHRLPYQVVGTLPPC
jgi:hypothetical protein